MKTSKLLLVLALGLAIAAMPLFVFGQKTGAASGAPRQELLKRIVSRSEKTTLGPGGTVTILGGPAGTVTVEGWNKREVEIVAEIELQAPTEADLALLTQVNGFVMDESLATVSVLTVGTFDKDYLKKKFKKFPKQLLNLPWKIDYTVRVPALSDLSITVGKGGLKIKGVEGAMQLKGAETDADLEFTGGSIIGTFGTGSVDLVINTRSLRGRRLLMHLAQGNMNVVLPASFNADIDASILRTGEIQNTYAPLKEREKNKFNNKLIAGRSGNGGALLSFTVGDGIMKLSQEAAK